MRICGQVAVDVPECEGFGCSVDCPLVTVLCRVRVGINWYLSPYKYLASTTLPGPTCPAFDTVPNPWPDYVCTDYGVTTPGDRPWSDEADDALIEVQLERANKK